MTELKINDFVKVTGFPVKNDNDIFIVDNQYANGEYCLKKVTLSGTQSKTKYSILFLKAKHFTDPTLSIETIPNVAGLKQAKKEVNNFLKGITAEEKVFSFIPANGTDLIKGDYIKVSKGFQITSSMYGIPTNTIYYVRYASEGRYTLHMVGKKGETLSTTGASGYNKVILTFNSKSIAGLFADGNIIKVERIESTKGEIATTETVEEITPVIEVEAMQELEVIEIDEQREQLINQVLTGPDCISYNGDINELTNTELETIIDRIDIYTAKQIISVTIDAENYAIITTGIGSFKCNYPKDEYFTNDYYIEEIKIDYRDYGLNSFTKIESPKPELVINPTIPVNLPSMNH